MNKARIQLLRRHILAAPLLMWVLLGFSVSYLLFFVYPVFFSAQVMQFFRYVPIIDPIGIDLAQMLSYSESWFVAKQTPYIGYNLYPPLASALFTPLLIVEYSWAYKIVTVVNVFCYVMMTLVSPLYISKKRRVSALLMLIFITGLFSYGFQFELERGQFNVIAVFICFLSIWIYHYQNRYCYLAYVLFTISVQLKVFPLVFVVMFISDWQDWGNNIKRILALVTGNFALFFVLGLDVFVGFTKAIIAQTVNPYIWVGNHSVRSFVSQNGSAWLNEYSGLVQLALLVVIAVCIFLVMLQAYRQKHRDLNPFLLLACTVGALLIPSVSHDYKLSILAAPVAIFFSNNKFWKRYDGSYLLITSIVLSLIFSAAYSSTLFSFTNKPPIVANNFPALFTILLTVTFLSLVYTSNFKERVSNPNINSKNGDNTDIYSDHISEIETSRSNCIIPD